MFCIWFCGPSKKRPYPAILWCYTLKGPKQRTLIRGSNHKGHKPPFSISVNLRYLQDQMKQKKHSFCVTISRRGKDGIQSIISFVLDHDWYEFQLKYWWLFLGFCKTQVPSRDVWCHQNGHISCCNSWKIREKSYLIHFHNLPCN